MSTQRQPSSPPRPSAAGRSGTRAASEGSGTNEVPESREVPTQPAGEDDPIVQALVGTPDGDPATLHERTRELSPESLALLLDRLDGMVEDNDSDQRRRGLWSLVPRVQSKSGVVLRPRRSGRGLRAWLSVAAVLLLIGLALLVWPQAPRKMGHVEDREGDAAWATDVQRVDLPQPPEPTSDVEEETATASEAEADEPATAPSASPRARGSVEFSREQGPAQIFLRGKLVGRVPGKVSLRAGRHDLLVRTPEGLSYYRRVHVRANETQQITLAH